MDGIVPNSGDAYSPLRMGERLLALLWGVGRRVFMADKYAAALERINESLQLVARLQAAALLEKEIATAKLEQIYALTGELPAEDIARKLRLSKSTVTTTQSRWVRMGLLQKDGVVVRKTFP
jgi:hypothetical protein